MKIMAALDLSRNAGKILEKAVEMAKAQKAELSIVTVAEDFSDIGDYFQSAGKVSEKLFEAAKTAASKYAETAKSLGVSAKVWVFQGVSPADLIIQAAEKENCDLIVMGRRAKTGMDRLVIGSVASKVVSHAKCSVLVVH